jgi:hypothetical protein
MPKLRASTESNELPTPRKKRVDLTTISDVRAEAASLYRRMRNGELDSQDGARMAFVLNLVAKLIESSDAIDPGKPLPKAVWTVTNGRSIIPWSADENCDQGRSLDK